MLIYQLVPLAGRGIEIAGCISMQRGITLPENGATCLPWVATRKPETRVLGVEVPHSILVGVVYVHHFLGCGCQYTSLASYSV